MQTIKFQNSSTIKLNGTIYKGYTVGNLPKRFASTKKICLHL
jgi:hypothetical protein